MNLRTFALTSALILLATIPAAVAASSQTADPPAAATPAERPGAVMADRHYKFEPVVDGTQVTHDFKVKNDGRAMLDIHQVKTG
ncbi:hypothetical protein DSCO28_59430 [Desulfosarcina ovata subsp. sediminis]|uniref:DUF1573 domain-containing protein n=2 Tax=Desulfosarcina ovata TaxID=83564 RepID=A0A5K7ZYM8_9BACT|nr:hypothetical protein DSCO28_59430 [Desulfosarcina ovata subsp. sediminis]